MSEPTVSVPIRLAVAAAKYLDEYGDCAPGLIDKKAGEYLKKLADEFVTHIALNCDTRSVNTGIVSAKIQASNR